MLDERRNEASETVKDLMSRAVSPEEMARRHPKLPELRLRSDTPTVEIDDTTPIKDSVNRLKSKDVDAIGIREAGSDVAAVILPVERYLELAAKELAGKTFDWVGTLDRHLVPHDDAFAASHVEQIDRNETWGE
ncbi:MAG TPA: hypothetical protein VLJ42_00360 [Solirubrobacteraceae bacterium]|nr:hypothetical protein [Solirubrobacteraceae bacterium]